MRVLLGVLVWILAEIALLVWLGGVIGVWGVLALVVGSGMLGVWLIRWQGGQLGLALRQGMRLGREPVTQSALVFVAAALLILPGVLGDLVGLGVLVAGLRGWRQGVPAADDVMDAEVIEEIPARLGREPSGWTKP